MPKYKLKGAEIINGVVELPDGAIPLQVGLILIGPFMDPDSKMRDGIKYLILESDNIDTEEKI